MRSTLIALLVVVALAAGVCACARAHVLRSTDELEDMRAAAAERLRVDDARGALQAIAALERRWAEVVPSLEIFASHDALHEVACELSDARVCLEAGDVDDCLRSLVRLGGALEHIRAAEEISLANLC